MPLIRSANFNLFVEILIRICLISTFCYLETRAPFIQVIHKEDLLSQYKYPHRDSIVPGGALWAIVLSVPCVLSMLAAGVANDCNDAMEILLAWSLSLGINGVLTDMLKLIVGRPRPDFYNRCLPEDLDSEVLRCTGDDQLVMDGRKSFPSGHSSLSWCSLGMLSLWVCGRLGVLWRRRGSGLRVLLALAPLVAAAGVALSRYQDYHHHWQDILVGSILGFSTSIFCYRQYYNPLSSDLAGVPYIVSRSALAKHVNGKPDVSPVKDTSEVESSPLLNGKKEDKWI